MPATRLQFIHHPRRIDTDFALALAADYLTALNSHLPHISQAQLDLYLKPTDGHWLLDQEEEQKLEEETRRRIEGGFPVAMRYSFVVFVQTLFESQMIRICKILKEEKDLPLNLNELGGGSDIERINLYLSKLAKVPVTEIQEWQHLRDYQKVRNCIVHKNGQVEQDERARKPFVELAAKYEGLAIENDALVLEYDFCRGHLITVIDFFEHLFSVLGWMRGLESS